MIARQSPPTAIVMLNLGGPASLEEVRPFLLRLFADREIIRLPVQRWMGPLIAAIRTPRVRARYAAIGGGSPLLGWTQRQGAGMVAQLDALSPHTASHKCYIAFRYAPPFAADALQQMRADGVRRAVAFTQYPQYSITTTGSSLNELWREEQRLGLRGSFTWSVIDRWGGHAGFVRALAESVRAGLAWFPSAERKDALLLFSAHSLPLKVVEAGDPYPQEVEATVQAVLAQLDHAHEHRLSYQSKVGPVKWLGPGTAETIRRLGVEKRRSVLVVPVSFTSDHIETLHEIDIELKELAQRCGVVHYHRAPALNAAPVFVKSLAEIVAAHLLTERQEAGSSPAPR